MQLIPEFAAEPASIIYIVTGAAGILLARFRPSKRTGRFSVIMLFCRRSTRDKMAGIALT